MPEPLLFPRLPIRAARARIASITGKKAAELTAIAASNHPEAEYLATGGNRVKESVLKSLREKLLDAAHRLGAPISTQQEKLVGFDPLAAKILYESMPILPGEASRSEVWSFVSLVLLPDVATWRFPEQNERRLIGGVRNAFQRLWWRAHLLTDADNADPLWLLGLPEDALVQLMERPAISSNRKVARTIARGIARVATLPSDVREDAWREAYKRIRQRFPLVNFDSLPEQELASQIDELCQDTIAKFSRNCRLE